MGADPEFRPRVKLFDGFCGQVRRGMPESSTAILVLPGKQGEMAILVDGASSVPHFFIHFRGQYVASQAFAQALGHFESRNPFGILLYRTVR